MKNTFKSYLKNYKVVSFSVIASTVVLFACTNKVESAPSFIFKPAPSKEAVASVGGRILTEAEVMAGAESDIYEAQDKVFQIKMAKIKSYLLQKFIDAHPGKAGLSNDQFLEKFILKDVKVTQKEISDFAKEKQIPSLNEELTKRIEQFLIDTKKRDAIEVWLASEIKKNPVEVYIDKPVRPVFNVAVGDAPVVGGKNPKVTIVEFSDFQCPFCSKAVPIMNELKKKFGNDIQVVFKNFPLPFHTEAKKAAEAGLCANEQGTDKFWQLHDMMFADQANIKEAGLLEKAKKIGLDMKKFQDCLTSSKMAGKIAETIAEGEKVGVKSTPTFFVNGQLVSGAQPVEVFSQIIEDEIAKAK